MGFLSSLSKKLGFSYDDEERSEEMDENEVDDEEDDEDEEEEEGKSRFSFGFASFFRRDASGGEQEPDEDEPYEAPKRETQQQSRTKRGNVIHDARMDPNMQQGPSYTHCERVVNVRQMEECRDLIRYLLRGESILLNLENIDPKDCGRVVDLLSGAAFALQGRMLKVAHLSYLLAPANVEVIEEDVYGKTGPRYR